MPWEQTMLLLCVHAQMRIGKSDIGKAFCVFTNNSHGGKTMGCETDWP